MRALFAVMYAVLSSTCFASYTIKPINGLWGIDAETSLAVGRAINIETGGGYLVVTMYNYAANGSPTFYVGAAPISSASTASVALSEPQNGTCLGCAPRSGNLRSSPGTALFEFTSSTTGFVTLPGEQRKAFSKGSITRLSAPDGLFGLWAWVRFAPTVASAFGDYMTLNSRIAGTTYGNGIASSSDGRFGCELQTTGASAGYVLCISITSTGSLNYMAVSKWFESSMDGLWQYTATSTITNVFTARRIVDGAGNFEVVKSVADTAALRAAFAEQAQILSRSVPIVINE